jgi:hypothetical protein
MRALGRGIEAMGDYARIAHHKLITEFGRQWEHPEAVLSDGDFDTLEARSLRRTLEAIDDLPESPPRDTETKA